MKTKKEIKQEIKNLRKEEAEERKDLIDAIKEKDRSECITDDLIHLALIEAQCEILEWVLEEDDDE